MEKSTKKLMQNNTLELVSNIILVVGILGSIILAFNVMFIENTIFERYEFNPSGFGITVAVLFSSICTWAFLRVVCNMAKDLHEINIK